MGNTDADICSRKLARDEQNAARAIAWTRAVCVLVSAASPSDMSGVFDKVIDDPRLLRSWLHGSAVWPLVIDGVSACSNARRAARLVDQWSRPMRRGSTRGDELAKRDTSYRSSSIVPIMCFQKKPHLVESRQCMLAGLRVEGPKPHALVHSDVEARRLIKFCSNTLHEYG
jgi:hypothetical protein